MAEQSYLPYVGHVLFPRRPDDLTSTTQCPACFTALAGTVCSVCGLDLGNPLAVELRAMSLESAAALDRRLELIGRIRFESAQVASVVPAAVAPVPVPVSVPAALASAPTTVAAPATPSAPPVQPVDAARRRHFGVQVILLIVGVSLLAIGAIFFLVYAFITFGLVWRSIIILAVTIAAFVGASLLRRRKLGATAEAIAALAVVFVYLDAFALRANDLFGAAASDGLLYWGLVLLLSAVGFVAWSRLTGLRLPSIVGFAAFAPGVALAVAGLLAPAEDDVRVFSTFAALALAGLVHPLGRPRTPERVIPLGISVVGVVSAAFIAFFLDFSHDWSATIGLAIVALIAFAHVALLLRTAAFRGFQYVFAALGGLLAAVALVPAGFRMEHNEYLVIVPVVAAAAIALALDLLARRMTHTPAIAAARVAATSAAVVGGIALFVPIVVALGSVTETLSLAIPRWTEPATRLLDVELAQVLAIAALAAVTALVALFWAASGVLARRLPVVVWAAVITAVLAVPLATVLWATVALWLALAAVGVTALIVLRARPVLTRLPIAFGAGLATVFAYTASWASLDLWWIGSIAAVALLLAARLAVSPLAARAAFLALAVVLSLVATGSQFWMLGEGAGAPVDATHGVGALATALLIAAALIRGRFLSSLDTRVVFWMSFVTVGVTAGLSWVFGATGTPGDRAQLVLPEFATSVALGAVALVAVVLWAVVGGTAAFGSERIAASVAIAPAVAWLVDSLTRLFVLPELVLSIAPIAGALLVAAVSLLIAIARPTAAPRTARDIGIALVAVPAVVSSVATLSPDAWLILLLGGIVALMVAICPDGLVGSASPRKHLGWLALALATAGLWWRLGDNSVRDVEPYVLPLAGALLLVALLAWRAARPDPSAAAPIIALGGLLVAILPVAGFATTGTATRTIIIVAVSAVLLLLGSVLRSTSALRPYLDVAAIAGAAGVIVGGFGRAISISLDRNTTDFTADVWLGVSFAVLLVGAIAQSRIAKAAAQHRVRALVGQAAAILSMVAVLTIELSLVTADGTGWVRAMSLVALFSALHVVAFIVDRAPLSRLVSWVSISLAAIAGIGGVARDAIDPLEWVTVPIAAALLVTGASHLSRTPSARSWAWLAPGLGVLLVPSLIATFVEQPAWRLVALGVACIVAIVVGATRKLQAPLIIGSVVVLVHGIRTFAPAIRSVYELTEWWVWAVVGGAIVLFLGLTFEKRVRDLRSVSTRVSSLR